MEKTKRVVGEKKGEDEADLSIVRINLTMPNKLRKIAQERSRAGCFAHFNEYIQNLVRIDAGITQARFPR